MDKIYKINKIVFIKKIGFRYVTNATQPALTCWLSIVLSSSNCLSRPCWLSLSKPLDWIFRNHQEGGSIRCSRRPFAATRPTEWEALFNFH